MDRDLTELNLLKRAEEKNIKTLAICRGHQLLNIHMGGTYIKTYLMQVIKTLIMLNRMRMQLSIYMR